MLLLEAQLGGAAQRVPIPDTGSLRDDLAALIASMRMLAGATLFDIVVADTPMRPEYIAQMLDIFVRGQQDPRVLNVSPRRSARL